MKKSVVGVILLLFIGACAGQEPSATFQKADMRIMTKVNHDAEIGVDTELLHMKPIDLYNVFDRDIRSKKWKKIHENSWMIVVSAKNPDAKYEITLVTVPQLNNNVIIKTVSINGHSQDSVATAEMIRSLDMSFSGKR